MGVGHFAESASPGRDHSRGSVRSCGLQREPAFNVDPGFSPRADVMFLLRMFGYISSMSRRSSNCWELSRRVCAVASAIPRWRIPKTTHRCVVLCYVISQGAVQS